MNAEELYKHIGRIIRKKRAAKSWTQEELACKADISLSFLGHIERGTRKLSVDTLYRIALALECSIDELTGSKLYTSPDSRRILIAELDQMVIRLQALQKRI